MLLPGCACCGSVYTCTDPYGRGSWTPTNALCGNQSLPCQLTLSVTPGGTWVNPIGLSTADRAAIISFCTRSFVFDLDIAADPQQLGYGYRWLMNQYAPLDPRPPGADLASGWFGALEFWDVYDPYGGYVNVCRVDWNRLLQNATYKPYGNMAYGCSGLYSKNLIWRGSTPGTSVITTLPSGVNITYMAIEIVPRASNWMMPFAPGDWCGLSSWSYTYTPPYNVTFYDTSYSQTHTFSARIVAVGNNPSTGQAASGSLYGHTITFSW